ncbi:uroporphyrinogen-III synthase [Oleiagrimonas sp. MCCC 1A03011]|uniref:uroporphyrinogen-III synthase n=1 Tax=Oleiagrimonas sp. MCCC 1A03011 TaxID=1926883 RepID=UPI001F0B9930|nr:uroporphyrinogen-III synthase [Oleiagrimonas sp. MCCC 1A03011]
MRDAGSIDGMDSCAQTLAGVDIVITRPSGTARALARRVRARGGEPHLLPGLSLRAMPEAEAGKAWRQAQRDDLLIFTSPAAVRFAQRLAPLDTQARVLAVGSGTRRALQRAGCMQAESPPRRSQHSEGLLEHPWLQSVRGLRVNLITAPGGRDLLATALIERGAQVRITHVYERVRPRLGRRHVQMVQALDASAWLLVTSAQALDNLMQVLPEAAVRHLQACRIVVSSARLQQHAREAGFGEPVRAASASAGDLLDAVAAHRHPR